ncbi:hypothetical protein ACFYTC_46315, partial [Actinomadura nitritigenes]|uniref:hypothetical protein n=1 Tax=Actinomadura nitritigenes TaxID=134602 RepID=UPI003694BF1D
MSDKRKREIRNLMAATGWSYTRAARELSRMRAFTGRKSEAAQRAQIELISPAAREALKHFASFAQVDNAAITNIAETIQRSMPKIDPISPQTREALKEITRFAQVHNAAATNIAETIQRSMPKIDPISP